MTPPMGSTIFDSHLCRYRVQGKIRNRRRESGWARWIVTRLFLSGAAAAWVLVPYFPSICLHSLSRTDSTVLRYGTYITASYVYAAE